MASDPEAKKKRLNLAFKPVENEIKDLFSVWQLAQKNQG
jgi:hypothetical protein